MRYLFLALAFSLACAPACLAQDYSNWEFMLAMRTNARTTAPTGWTRRP